MILNLSYIVEGHGEVSAIRILLQRIQLAWNPALYLGSLPHIRRNKNKLVKSGELEGAVEFIARRIRPPRAILILIDADDDCPAKLGPELLARAQQARSDVSIGVVLANREYEAWFLASVQSLAGERGLPDNLSEVTDPEAKPDAKGRLTQRMQGSRTYSETADQPGMTAKFDMQMARRNSPSFDKCWREIERLFVEAARE